MAGILVSCALLAACSDEPYALSTSGPAGQPTDAESYLALEHRATVDMPEDTIATAFDATIQACGVEVAWGCAVLESQLTRGETVRAHVRVRLKPAGVEPLILLAAKYGAIETRSTQAEDLAKPIIDAEKRPAMLNGYMVDLARLRQQSRADVDALIKVTSEIAKTQSEIEALTGEHAQLRQRVELQVLELVFFSERSLSFFAPISSAFGDFGSDLSSGIGQTISGLAYLLPWLIILVPLALLFRYLWRKLR